MQNVKWSEKSPANDFINNKFHVIGSFLGTVRRSWTDPDAVRAIGESILSLLESPRKDAEIESDLFDLVGDPEETAGLLQRRSDLLKHKEEIRTSLSSLPDNGGRLHRASGAGKSSPVSLSETDVSAIETVSLGKSKSFQSQDDNCQIAHQAAAFRGRLIQAQGAPASSPNRSSGTSALQDHSFVGVDELVERDVHETEMYTEDLYREIFMPPPVQHRGNEQRLCIKDCIDPPLQKVFENIEHLNPVQSAVFQAVYHTSENLLICAPTGAGKTNIALLAITRELRHRTNSNTWRCVYIAPMRALATEVVHKFATALRPLGVEVLEYTGDTNPSATSVRRSQIFVSTPEKWDVLSRNSIHWHTGVAASLRLLIIDEIHLLHDDRGPVLEAVVARTLRMSENQQQSVRIVGLSATLPNYTDIAEFLRVNPQRGLFFFDQTYRPVPLGQRLIGIRRKKERDPDSVMVEVCYEKARSFITEGHQIIIFVHSRKKTKWLAGELLRLARDRNESSLFTSSNSCVQNAPRTTKSIELLPLLSQGLGIHHAGITRSDRQLVERMFREGSIRVLISTATLAWGINLPARAVLIYGTKIYDARRGGFVDIGILDVLQIFGRAGRPQFDNYGEGIILTEEQRLPFFYRLLNLQLPIESQILNGFAIVDHLNAEIASGCVASERDALAWFDSLYVSVRLAKNPLHYGISRDEVEKDHTLATFRSDIVQKSIDALMSAGLVSTENDLLQLEPTDWGIVACRFYISYQTIHVFRELLHPDASISELIHCISLSSEFEQIALREEEIPDLEILYSEACPYEFPLSRQRSSRSRLEDHSEYWLSNAAGKVYVLLQSYVSSAPMKNFALLSDMRYIEESATRLFRAIFEISVRLGWSSVARRANDLARAVERRVWPFEHPFAQAHDVPLSVLDALKKRDAPHDLQSLREFSESQWHQLLGSTSLAHIAKRILAEFPRLDITGSLRPLSARLIRIQIRCTPYWEWGSRLWNSNAGELARYTLWIEMVAASSILYFQHFSFSKDQVRRHMTSRFDICLNLIGDWPPRLRVVFASEHWLGVDQMLSLESGTTEAPRYHSRETLLLNLRPLTLDAIGIGSHAWDIFPGISHMNPIQSQVFHALLHTDTDTVIDLPPNAGKGFLIFLCILRQMRLKRNTGCRILYLNPHHADISASSRELSERLSRIGVRTSSFSEWVGPKHSATENSVELICATPRMLLRDSVYRPEQYLDFFDLLLFDNLQALNEDDGAFYEIALVLLHPKAAIKKRKIGFSHLVGNVGDLAVWLSMKQLFHFTIEQSPIPLEYSILSYREQSIEERFARMDQTIHKMARYHSRQQLIVFVQSESETLETARRLLRAAAADGYARRMVQEDFTSEIEVMGVDISQFIAFGIGPIHGKMSDVARGFVQDLFEERKLSTLLVPFRSFSELRCRAPVVIIKGSETDEHDGGVWKQLPMHMLLEILEHCGCPETGRGVLYMLVADSWKAFYEALLQSQIPVEAGIRNEDDLGLMICHALAANADCDPDCSFETFKDTFLWKRISNNPSFYPWKTSNDADIRDLFESCLIKLVRIGLIRIEPAGSERLRMSLSSIGKFSTYCGFRLSILEHMHALICALKTEQNCDFNAKAREILLRLRGERLGDAQSTTMHRLRQGTDFTSGLETSRKTQLTSRPSGMQFHLEHRKVGELAATGELAMAAALMAAQNDVSGIIVPLLKGATNHKHESGPRRSPSGVHRDLVVDCRLVRHGPRDAKTSLSFPEFNGNDGFTTKCKMTGCKLAFARKRFSVAACFVFSSTGSELLGATIAPGPVSDLAIDWIRDIPASGKLNLKLFYLSELHLQEVTILVE
jgi:activating signal cointegrator complex subunit 3